MDHSAEYNYQNEQRMIQFRAKIWKKIHKDSNSRPSTKQLQRPQSARSGHDARNTEFCERFLRLPGEVRNQIYDELLRRQPQGKDFDQTPLFRTIHVSKRSHAAATFAGPAWLPISPFTSLRYIGRNHQIWDEIFSRWTSSVRFNITEAFEIQSKPSSIKDRLLLRRHSPKSQSFARYLDPEISRVFDHSNSWFPLMRSCTLRMHIFGIGAPSLKEEELLGRLRTCMEGISNVLKQAKDLADIAVDIYFWPGGYSERASWVGCNYRPSLTVLWNGVEPLKKIKGIAWISVHAGNSIDAKWDATVP